MRVMITSDIHGSAYFCRSMLEVFEKERADRLIILGDILYHGPRNDLPRDYTPKEVVDLLNSFREKLLCVRGNCDAEVDQMVLGFPIMADYAIIPYENNIIYLTHGHTYNETNPPPLCFGDILLCGHTHIPCCVEYENFTYMNPGSVAIPKNGSENSYIILDDRSFFWKRLSDSSEYLRYN